MAHDRTSSVPQREPDAYLETIKRMEPDIAFIDASAGWASIAISLKRIADASERIVAVLESTNEYGEQGAQAIARGIIKGLRGEQ